MGSLTLTPDGVVYIDSNILIYTVERVAPIVQMLDPFWQGLAGRGAHAITSELTALETLVGPMRSGDVTLEALFRRILFRSPTLRLAPVTRDVLERAARLRPTTTDSRRLTPSTPPLRSARARRSCLPTTRPSVRSPA